MYMRGDLLWHASYSYTVEPLYSGLDTLGTACSVLIKRGVLILGVVLYTSLCNW